MPVFRITACHVGAQQGLVDFTVLPVSGEMQVGDRFVCYDTHHPVEYQVREAHTTPEHTRLVCEGWLGFDDQFTGAAVDTAGKRRPEAFRYEKDVA